MTFPTRAELADDTCHNQVGNGHGDGSINGNLPSADLVHVKQNRNGTDKLADDALSDTARVYPWILCLVAHANDKDYCTNLVRSWLIGVETLEAVLVMFALAGLQCFLMLNQAGNSSCHAGASHGQGRGICKSAA